MKKYYCLLVYLKTKKKNKKEEKGKSGRKFQNPVTPTVATVECDGRRGQGTRSNGIFRKIKLLSATSRACDPGGWYCGTVCVILLIFHFYVNALTNYQNHTQCSPVHSELYGQFNHL